MTDDSPEDTLHAGLGLMAGFLFFEFNCLSLTFLPLLLPLCGSLTDEIIVVHDSNQFI